MANIDIYNLQVGQIVFSKSGRDKTLPFIVVKAECDYLWLVNGQQRRLEKPKMKKLRHVQPTKIIVTEISDKIISNKQLTDAEFKKALDQYMTT
ncbi:MAG: KOW domain-containing RNA-binding protein [Defluviitaleaceae bacterium]|nr:KOW domain-containing RNA-binding protein [Defluviitaleaceae bacterium]